MTQGVYALSHKCNGKMYVGASVNIENRYKGHIKSLRDGEHTNWKLQNAWDETNNCFELVILEIVNDITKLCECERDWLEELNVVNLGYNRTNHPNSPRRSTNTTNSKPSTVKTMVISMDADMIDGALARVNAEFIIPISQAAFLRTLIGVYAEGRVPMRPAHVMKYSPESFKGKKTRKNQ
jgi:group I intron endonuclease